MENNRFVLKAFFHSVIILIVITEQKIRIQLETCDVRDSIGGE